MNSRQFPVALLLTALILTGAVHAQTSPLANRISAHSQMSPFADRIISRSQLASTPNPFNPVPFQNHGAALRTSSIPAVRAWPAICRQPPKRSRLACS